MNRLALLVGAAATFIPAVSTFAQTSDDVVVMRRVIAKSSKNQTTPAPSPTPSGPDANGNRWLEGEWGWMQGTPSCTDAATRIRTVSCVDAGGSSIPDSSCLNTRPATTEVIGRYETCSYSWGAGSWGAWGPACTEDASRSREVFCLRSGDGAAPARVGDEFCSGQQRPPETETGPNVDQCSYYWRVGEFGPWEGSCESKSTRKRTVLCATADGKEGDESECVGRKPAEVQEAPVPNQCSYNWEVGDWESFSSYCASEAVRNRKVQCVAVGGDLVGAPQPDEKCLSISEKPAPTEKSEIYSGCTYRWTSEPTGEWSSTCSANATRAVTATCVRSDESPVSDSFCDPSKRPSGEQVGNYAGCAANWVAGEWSPYDSSCSAVAERTRTVQCYVTGPDFDPRLERDDRCDASSRPVLAERTSITSGCTMKWNVSEWGAWSSTCSADAVRERSVRCAQSDGTTLPDAQCEILGEKPVSTETGNFSKCEFKWSIGSWSDWTEQCSASATRLRSVVCRDDKGAAVADSSCVEEKPETSETGYFGGCARDWAVGEWGDWSSTCSKDAERTRSVSCVRSDGTVLEDNLCSGEQPARDQRGEVTSSCSYQWKVGEWQMPEGCSSSVVMTRSVSCLRSDGSVVSDGQCSGAGAKPETTQQGASYSTCTYKWYNSGLVWNSTCSATATQSQTVYCQRSNGDAVEDAFCANQGAKPSSTGTQTGNYSGCTYDWAVGEWGWNDIVGAWSSDCSKDARQTRAVSCHRSDGSTVLDSSCGQNKPVTSQSAYRDTGCTNKWVPDDTSTYQATACVDGSITIWETYKCVNSSGQTISPSSGSYCSKIGIGPLSTTADNVIPTQAQCSMVVSSVDLPSSRTGDTTPAAQSTKLVSGTFFIAGTTSVGTASVQKAASDACFAAAKNFPATTTPICSLVSSWSDASGIYYDWSLRLDQNKYITAGASSTCDMYNESFSPPAGATDLRRSSCGTSRFSSVDFSTVIVSGASFSNPLTCSRRINMNKTLGMYPVSVPLITCQ